MCEDIVLVWPNTKHQHHKEKRGKNKARKIDKTYPVTPFAVGKRKTLVINPYVTYIKFGTRNLVLANCQ